MAASNLCEFCSGLPFDRLGYYEPTLPYSARRGVSGARELDEILQDASFCTFCKAVSDAYQRWRSRKFAAMDPIELVLRMAQFFLEENESVELDGRGFALAGLITLTVNIELWTPGFHERFYPHFSFQRTVTDPHGYTCLQAFDESVFLQRQLPPYCGRVRPMKANLKQLRWWMETCLDTHSDACGGTIDGPPVEVPRMIDVKKCNIDFPWSPVSYAALSYVWGKDTEPWLLKANEHDMKKEGSLTRDSLPTTIADAITVVEDLGLRYLWVDSCCIIQDDIHDKAKIIPQMGAIYGNATITIVAASGSDAHAGLPGVRESSRVRIQEPLRLKDAALMESLGPIRYEYGQSYLGDVVWNQRAWTYQERLLSSRVLVFTEDQVYWECATASHCEDVYSESINAKTIYNHSFEHKSVLKEPWTGKREDFSPLYLLLIRKYSERSLSNELDGMNAVQGILNRLADKFSQCFFWGLPEEFFSSALSWSGTVGPEDENTPRVGEHQTIGTDGTVSSSRFPTWSWIGWLGNIYRSDGVELQPSGTSLVFYRLDRRCELIRIQETTSSMEVPPGSHVASEPSKKMNEVAALNTQSWVSSQTKVVEQDIPIYLYENPELYRSVILFYTSIAPLTLADHPDNIMNLRDVVTTEGQRFGADLKHLPDTSSRESDKYDGIVIGSTSEDDSARFLSVVLAHWEDGIAFRYGLISLKEMDWIRIADREWRLVVLG